MLFKVQQFETAENRKKRKFVFDSQAPIPETSKVTQLSCGASTKTDRSTCFFFCDDASGMPHQTFNMDKRVRQCALDLQDTVLLAKFCDGDLMSQEAIYHVKCRLSLYSKERNEKKCSDPDSTNKKLKGIVLAELVFTQWKTTEC